MIGPAARLVHERGPGQDRLAVFDKDNRLLEIWFDPAHQPNLIGTVHRLRLSRLFSGQNRATANLADGTAVSIRLRKADMATIKQGDWVTVTIDAAPRDGKPWQARMGSRLVARDMILLAGLADDAPRFYLSSHVDAAMRDAMLDRLEHDVGPLLPAGCGLIARRGAVACHDLAGYAARLCHAWNDRVCAVPPHEAGQIHDGGGLVGRAMRLYPDVPVIDGSSAALADDSIAIDQAVQAAMSPRVPMDRGATLWCERTHALWSIDVDGGGRDDFDRLGAEVAVTAAWQVRVRQMGGPVMLDMPRLTPAARRTMLNRLATAMMADPRQPEILGQTRGGLIEIILPHGEMPPADVMHDSPAQEALAGLRLVARSAAGHRVGARPLCLGVSQAVADWLAADGAAAMQSLDRPVALVVWSDGDKTRAPTILDAASR